MWRTVWVLPMSRWQTLLRPDAGLRVQSTPAFLVTPGLNATPCSIPSETILNFSISWPSFTAGGTRRKAVTVRMQLARVDFEGVRRCRLGKLFPSHVSALSDARLHEEEWRQGTLGDARSIKPSEGSRSRLRRTRVY